jgi:nucleoid-associated protein YgaU
MAGIALLLAGLTPALPEAAYAMAHAQDTVDSRGADALVLSAVGLVAWSVWAWGVLGLALTAASALPGVVGGAARRLVGVLLPAGARRGAALALGLGLGFAAPALADVGSAAGGPVLVTAASAAVPDWPTGEGDAVPDWPAERPADSHVVVRGDCLWDIAARRLSASGSPVTDAAIAAQVHAWWSANADVIGSNPDLILPGQVLRAPRV